jgi:hypothetical protein
LVTKTSCSRLASDGPVERKYFIGSASPSGHSISSLDIVNYDVRLRDNYDGRRIDSSELQLALTCCLT